MTQALWVEKYRPKVISDYVFKDEQQKKQIEKWIKEKHIPNLLFSGAAGTGKTTLAKVLLNELNVDPYDIKQINASKDNGVDYIRESVSNFAGTIPYGDYKYILFDEADYITTNGQAILRGEIEKYSNSVRFLFTANYPQKIIPALHSRCQGFHIDKLNKDEFTVRIATILVSENVEFTVETLDAFVDASYPDLRKCINLIQMNASDGKLLMPEEGNSNTSDYKLDMITLFRKGKHKEARELICKQIGQEEYEDFFKFMYQKLDLWADTEDKENKAILIIRDGLVKHTMAADPEINLSACLTELSMVAKGIL